MPKFHIRPAETDDMRAIIALNDLAFGQTDEGQIAETLEADGDVLLSLIAESDDQEIFGHILFFGIELQAAMMGGKIAGLGPMSVKPELQKSGIGSALIRAGLKQLKQDGVHRVFVLGHKDYYPKFGFSVDATAGFAAPWGGPYFMALELNPGGPDFGQLGYPSAFFES